MRFCKLGDRFKHAAHVSGAMTINFPHVGGYGIDNDEAYITGSLIAAPKVSRSSWRLNVFRLPPGPHLKDVQVVEISASRFTARPHRVGYCILGAKKDRPLHPYRHRSIWPMALGAETRSHIIADQCLAEIRIAAK